MVNSVFNWLLITALTMVHPFYVSKIELNHNSKDKNIEVSIRVFTDDMEATLQQFGKVKVDLSKTEQTNQNDKLITAYIKEKLKVMVDEKPVQLEYVGYEINKESVWMYFEVDHITALKKIDIACSLLYEYQQKQMNIIQAKANNIERNFKLDNPDNKVSFSF